MNRKERQRHEYALFATTGVYHTIDQWTRALMPFTQWNIIPHIPLEDLFWLTGISTTFTFIGTIIMAQMIDVLGLRTSALISTILVALYQLLVSQISNYYLFVLVQVLLMFNNIQMIIDAAILNLEGEDGDYKKRTRLITKILIPTSIGYAAGPYCALQMIFFVSPSLVLSQSVCGIIGILTLVPLVWAFFPDNANKSKSLRPDLGGYLEILSNERTRWTAIILMLVTGPYAAYDNLVRISLASSALRDPSTIHNLFLILGMTSLLVNVLILPILQNNFTPQVLLTASFGILFCSYTLLSFFQGYSALLLGMPLQVIGVTICIGEISSQLMGTIGKGGAGKAAALLRMCQLASGVLVPAITGTYFHHDDTNSWLCVFSAILSASAIVIIRQYGAFMKFNSACLPGICGKVE